MLRFGAGVDSFVHFGGGFDGAHGQGTYTLLVVGRRTDPLQIEDIVVPIAARCATEQRTGEAGQRQLKRQLLTDRM